MALIFVTRRIPEAGLRVLQDAGIAFEIGQPDGERGLDRATLLDGIRRADVVLSLLTERIDAEALNANPRLRGVANMAVGYNNIDVACATALGIPVSNTPGVLTETTADLTWALLLAVARRIPAAEAYLRAGRYQIWGPELFLGADVGTGPDGTPRTLGIIGLGRIGRAVARRARGFDMRVIAHSPGATDTEDVRIVPLDQLLAESDFVTIHAPFNSETRHLVGERELRLMKETAFLINVARGELVNERALVRALEERWIAGAALDVYEHEPELARGLVDCPNALLVPHIGSASLATRSRMAILAATNAIAHLRGERAPDPVDASVYDSPAYRARVS